MEGLSAYDSSSSSSSGGGVGVGVGVGGGGGGPPSARRPRPPSALPVLVYIEVPCAAPSALPALADACVAEYSRALAAAAPAAAAAGVWRRLPDADAYVPMPLHISLSRYAELTAGSCADFVAALRCALQPAGAAAGGAFAASLEGCVALPASREATAVGGSGAALFLTALVGAGRARVLQHIAQVDAVFRAFGLPTYYSPAEPHASLAVLRAPPGAPPAALAALAGALAALEAAGAPAALAAASDAAGAPPPSFAVAEVCVKVGKRVFRIPL
jgi:hypothetical protein